MNCRRPQAQLGFLDRLEIQPDFLLLQEVTPYSYRLLKEHFRASHWSRYSLEFGRRQAQKPRQSGYGSAVLGSRDFAVKEARRLSHRLLRSVPDPRARDLTLLVRVSSGRHHMTLLSLHIPNAQSWGYESKREMIRAIASRFRHSRTTTIVGIDANSPWMDHPDQEQNQYTKEGTPKDRCERLLHGSGAHRLRDVYRIYLEDHPVERDGIRRKRRAGPLAISHRRGGVPCRYDFILASPDVEPIDVRYHENAMPTYSDHALVVAEVELSS